MLRKMSEKLTMSGSRIQPGRKNRSLQPTGAAVNCAAGVNAGDFVIVKRPEYRHIDISGSWSLTVS